MTVEEMVDSFGNLGYQAIELNEATKVVLKMKRSGSKVFLTFTSNMVTSGLRGFFAQLLRLVSVCPLLIDAVPELNPAPGISCILPRRDY